MACGGSDSLVGGVAEFTSSPDCVSLFISDAAKRDQALVDVVADAGTWLLGVVSADSGLSPQAANSATAASSAREVLILMIQAFRLHDAVDQAVVPLLPGFPYLFTPIPGAR